MQLNPDYASRRSDGSDERRVSRRLGRTSRAGLEFNGCFSECRTLHIEMLAFRRESAEALGFCEKASNARRFCVEGCWPVPCDLHGEERHHFVSVPDAATGTVPAAVSRSDAPASTAILRAWGCIVRINVRPEGCQLTPQLRGVIVRHCYRRWPVRGLYRTSRRAPSGQRRPHATRHHEL